MLTIEDICIFLERFAPTELAEDWDNVGLLVGDRDSHVRKIMTCLTVTPESVQEAVGTQVDLIVTHHPLPFRALKKLTHDDMTGRMLLELIQANIGVYSPHTAFDSAAAGINQRLAGALGLTSIQPLIPFDRDDLHVGSGRFGDLPEPVPLAAVAEQLKTFLGLKGLHCVGSIGKPVKRVGVACGAAGQYLRQAREAGCDLLVTGETNFHTCLEAKATDVALLLPGHFASERFAVEALADVLANQFNDAEVWASEREADPLHWC